MQSEEIFEDDEVEKKTPSFAEKIQQKYKKDSGPKTPRTKNSLSRHLSNTPELTTSYPRQFLKPNHHSLKHSIPTYEEPSVVIKKRSQQLAKNVEQLIREKKLSQTAETFISQSHNLPLRQLNNSDLSEDERRQTAYFSYVSLNEKNNKILVPGNWQQMSIDQLERMAHQANSQHKKGNKVSHLQLYIIVGSVLFQVVGGRIFDMEGYITTQFKMLNSYNDVLSELGDSEPGLTGEDWSPWSKLLFYLVVNSIVFIALKKMVGNPDAIIDMFANSRGTTPQVTEGQSQNGLMGVIGNLIGGGGLGGLSAFAPILGQLMGNRSAPTAEDAEQTMDRPVYRRRRPGD